METLEDPINYFRQQPTSKSHQKCRSIKTFKLEQDFDIKNDFSDSLQIHYLQHTTYARIFAKSSSKLGINAQ
jgi:hypothetical protein